MQQGCWDELEAKISQSRAGAWEDHPALALPIALYTDSPGVIAQCTESSEPEDSLKSNLKPPPQCSFQQGLQGSVKFLCEPKCRKQQTAKWVKQQWFPSSSPLLPSSGEQDCCALQCPQRAHSLGKRQFWDVGRDTHHCCQPQRALTPGYIPTCSSVAMTVIMWPKSEN